jgi:hypothetical protein
VSEHAASAGGDRGAKREGGDLRAVETTILLLVALLLAIATVNDVSRQVQVSEGLVEDENTWRAYTHHDYRNVVLDSEHFPLHVVCGNTSPGEPKQRIQLCLVITRPGAHGKRQVSGGWYLPAHVEDAASLRYACFGSATPSEFGCSR